MLLYHFLSDLLGFLAIAMLVFSLTEQALGAFFLLNKRRHFLARLYFFV